MLRMMANINLQVGYTEYWLELLEATDFMKRAQDCSELKRDASEMIRLLNAIIKTTKERVE